MQVQLEIYLKQVLKIVLHWGGGAMTDIHAKVPCHPFSFPYTEQPEHYQVKHKYLQWLLCERDLALSATGQMAPQRSWRICVADTLTTQQHKETSYAFWTLYSPLEANILHIVKCNSQMQCSPKEDVAQHEHLSTCHLLQNNCNDNGYAYSQNCMTQFHAQIYGTHSTTHRDKLHSCHITYWTSNSINPEYSTVMETTNSH